MTNHTLLSECTPSDMHPVDAQMRAYLRAFVTVVVPGSIVSLALCLTMLSGVLA